MSKRKDRNISDVTGSQQGFTKMDDAVPEATSSTSLPASSDQLDRRVETGWAYVRSSVKPEISISPLYVIAAHVNTRDVMLFHVSDASRGDFDRCALVTKHAEEVTSLALMPDNVKFLTGGNDSVIYTWSVVSDNGRMTAKCVGEMKLESAVRMLSSHPQHDRIAIVLSGNVVLLRHLCNDGQPDDEVRIQIKDSNVTALSQGPHTLVYGTDTGMVYVWQYESPDNLVTFYRATSSRVHFLSTSNDTIASWGKNDDYIRVWDRRNQKSTGTLCTGSDRLANLIQAPDGSHVIALLATNDVIVYQCQGEGFGKASFEEELCLMALDDNDAYLVSKSGSVLKRNYRELGSSETRPGCGERITNTDVIKAEVTKLTSDSEKRRKTSTVCEIL